MSKQNVQIEIIVLKIISLILWSAIYDVQWWYKRRLLAKADWISQQTDWSRRQLDGHRADWLSNQGSYLSNIMFLHRVDHSLL